MNYFKPINLLDARAYRPERMAVYDAIANLFMASGLGAFPPVADYGCWRHPEYIDAHGYMVPYLSVKWYVEQAREPSRRRIDAHRMMSAFQNEPWRREESLGDHYDVLLIDEPLFDPAEEEHFGLTTTPGCAFPGIAVVLSTDETDRLDRVGYSLLKTLAMRELAHAFGVATSRSSGLEVVPRLACTGLCILGRCIEMPDDLQRLTDLRLAGAPFCDLCLEELRSHLTAPS